jgi:hypothetical protein
MISVRVESLPGAWIGAPWEIRIIYHHGGKEVSLTPEQVCEHLKKLFPDYRPWLADHRGGFDLTHWEGGLLKKAGYLDHQAIITLIVHLKESPR